MIDQLQLIVKALPWTIPAVLGGFVLALVTMLLFPTRRSRTDRFGFALLTWCLVVAAVVTLSPVKNDYFGVPTLGCDWSVWKPLARQYWFSAGSRPPNVWLLFPAGVGVMLLDGVWRKVLGVMFLVALPPGVETLQDLYPELKRSCSSQDVADNWTGLAMGLALGLVLAILVGIARFIRRSLRRRRNRRDGVLTGERDVETTDDDARLPLGGRADNRRYDDFADFDDKPNSSRWYEQEPGSSGATQVIAADAVDHTPAYGTPMPDRTPDRAITTDTTEAFNEGHGQPRGSTSAGSARDSRIDPDDDSTVIIPRR